MITRKISEEEAKIIDLLALKARISGNYEAKSDILFVEQIDENGSIKINNRNIVNSDPICTGYIKKEHTVENFGPYIEVILLVDQNGLPSELQIYSQDGHRVTNSIAAKDIIFFNLIKFTCSLINLLTLSAWGYVSQRCGGNPVQWTPGRRRR